MLESTVAGVATPLRLVGHRMVRHWLDIRQLRAIRVIGG